MACTATYNTTQQTFGAYGVYNNFFVFIENVSGSTTNLKFRIRVTDADSNQYTLDVVPNAANDAVINPLIRLRDTYFKSDYSGQLEAVNAEGYNEVQIEVGEISGTPATFQGYDTDHTFIIYNGYEKDKANQLNYRIPTWYDTTPYLLPKTKKEVYLLSTDTELLSMPYKMNLYDVGEPPNTYGLKNIVFEYYQYSSPLDILLSTSTIDLTARPTFSGSPAGYWNFDINTIPLHDGTTDYCKVYTQYEYSGDSSLTNSEALRLYPLACKPKYERFRLRWINRYGGEEYENFEMRATESISITRGKKILSDGVDYGTTTFGSILDVNNPQISEFGKSYQRNFVLRSDWLTQDQLESLEELYTSPAVLMFDSNDDLFPVIVEDSSYEIKDVKQGLKKVEVRVSIANRQPTQLQ